MRPRARGLWIVAVALCFVTATAGFAGERVHRVRPGESASSIAKKYYGDFDLTELLLWYNGKPGTTLQVGEQLRVPSCDVHVVRKGDSWSGLAQQYLGKASAYPAIAVLNGLSPRQPLQLGDRIVMPVVFAHELRRGETLGVIAERYYGDPARSQVLQLFNQIDDPRRLSVGQTVQVPVISMRPAGEAPGPKSGTPRHGAAASSKPSSGPPKPSTSRTPRSFHEEIAEVSQAYDDGDFDRAWKLLESLRDPVEANGTDSAKTKMLRLLTFVYVAFDLPDEACDTYASLKTFTPKPRLDPDRVSPKIREILAECGGGSS